MNLRILPEADGEVIAAAEWYDARSPGLGDEFLGEVEQAYQAFRGHAVGGSPLEYYTGSHPVRRVLLRRFPYAVIGLVRSEETLIVAVAHTHRRPLYWAARLG